MNLVHNLLPLPFSLKPDLEDLIEGENRLAINAIRLLFENERPATRSIYLWGARGCGKTHLLRATVTATRVRHLDAFFVGDNDAIFPPISGLLAIDDIQQLSEKNRLSLFDWQNKTVANRRCRLLMAGDSPPDNLPLGDEIINRLCTGLVFQLREISETEKRHALERYAQRRGFDLPDNVMKSFLDHLPRDMSSLTAAVVNLDQFLLTQKKPLTSQSVHHWLRHYQQP